jgi:hypothetical protein
MDALLTQITIAGGNQMVAQQKKAEEDSSEAVKAALLISGADRCRYGVLKDALANNYLLGNDQYPDTYDKAFRVLTNYQVTKTGVPYRASPDKTRVAFLQRGGRGGRGGHGGRGGPGDKNDHEKNEGGNDDMSTMTGKTSGEWAQTNSVRMSDCCLQGIKPCDGKGKRYPWVGNRVFRLGSRKEKKE